MEARSDTDVRNRSLFNIITDPCPELKKKQVQTFIGFDYADKKG